MKTKSKLLKGAEIAQSMGYKYIYSIVKTYYNTQYYHVVKLEDILREGKWIPAAYVRMSGKYRKLGVTKLPEKALHRFSIYSLANK